MVLMLIIQKSVYLPTPQDSHKSSEIEVIENDLYQYDPSDLNDVYPKVEGSPYLRPSTY